MGMMHPVIKIVSLIILTVFVTQGRWLTLLLSTIFLLPYYLQHSELWLSAIKMLLRLKWFFLSIFVIYFFYTPQLSSTDINSIASLLMSLSERSMTGLLRIAVLIIIIFAVNIFIKTTRKEDILSALLWIFSPLNFFNLNIDRMLLRAILTLEYIEELSLRLSCYKQAYQKKSPKIIDSDTTFIHRFKQKKTAFFHLVEHSSIILHDILNEANNTSGKMYTITCLSAPSVTQLFFPLLLCFSLYLTL